MEFKDREPNSQDAMSDEQLSAILRKWDVDGAPADLEARVFARPHAASRRWGILVPAAVGSLAFALGAGFWLLRPRPVAPAIGAAAVSAIPAPEAAPQETPVAFDGPAPSPLAPADPPARTSDPDAARSRPTHVDFFSDFFLDSGRGSQFAAKPAPPPFPQSASPAPQTSNDATSPLPPGVYRVGNGVNAPSVLKKTEPQYSDEARIARLSGASIIKLVISEDGTGRDFTVPQPVGLGLDEKAVESLKSWSFKPGVKEGTAVPVAATIQVNFRLDSNSGPWHLTRALFTPAAGAARPVLLQAPYPADAGTPENDTVRVSFNVDPNGIPIDFHSQSTANPRLEAEAIGILSGWRFRPGMNNGKPVTTPAAFELAHSIPATPDASVISLPGPAATANLIDKIQPVYPPEAKNSRLQGSVRLQVRIGKDGRVISTSLISGDPILAQAAIEAVRQWLYRPTLINGNPVEVNTQVDVNFTLL